MFKCDSRLEQFKKKMEISIENFQKELAGIRAGRASTSLLEPLRVDAYGTQTPMSHIGTISSPDSRTLTINVWDKGLVKFTEKAIRDSGIGLNPIIEGQLIRIPIPPLSEEGRKDLAKLAAKYAEETKIALRNIRREAMDFIKSLEKSSEISEDEMHKLSDNTQNMIDEFSKQTDSFLAKKHSDITCV
ncbi:MAG: ribosome recycling factor [Holosporales bacterium]|jgi:ribosome recycling factor|nr:ribosome recycling factor [Holosporales bacterium]